MLPTKILTILISLVFLSGASYAQTSTSTTGNFTFLNKGAAAPFDGTLFDPLAVAKILSDKRLAEEQCKIKLDSTKQLQEAKCQRDVKILKAELDIERKKHNLIVTAQKEEIETLRELAKGSDTTWWTAIGFVVGAASSIAIFFAATEIVK